MTAHASVKLLHYIYSSLEGYRTLYRSPGLDPRHARALEQVAARIYRTAARGADVRSVLHLDPAATAAVRVFQLGADGAGRARCCVHAVVPERDARAIDPFNLPDEAFIERETDLDAPRAALLDRLVVPGEVEEARARDRALRAAAALQRVALRHGLAVLLAAPARRVLVRGPIARTTRLLRSLAPLVPREALADVSLAALGRPGELDHIEGVRPPRIELVPSVVAIESLVAEGERAALDLASERARSWNLAEPPSLVRLVEDALLGTGNRALVERALRSEQGSRRNGGGAGAGAGGET